MSPRLHLVASLLAASACTEPGIAPVAPAAGAARSEVTARPEPDAPSVKPSSEADASAAVPEPDAGSVAETEPPEIRPGVGTCNADTDCEVGYSIDPARNGKSACCFRFCPPPGVVSRAVLEKEAAWRDKSCGPMTCGKLPPKPCRPNADVVIPRCVSGRCASEVHHRPPPTDPML